MVPAQTNHDVAAYTTEELLHAVPERFGIKNFARRLTICALNENVRIAMMYVYLFICLLKNPLCFPEPLVPVVTILLC